MTIEQLRHKVRDRTPVWWRAMGNTGWVTRVATSGDWADMVWCCGRYARLNGPPDHAYAWRKRQPLDRIGDWEHG